MSLFSHHPARVGALRDGADGSDRAARQTREFADMLTGVAAEVPRAVEGNELVDAARRPLARLDERAARIESAQRLQGKAARLWADAVENFNGRVDALNDVWDQANPSAWQVAVGVSTTGPLAGIVSGLATSDDHEEARAELRKKLTSVHAQLEDQLDDVAEQIAATLDAGPCPAVDQFYRVMTVVMAKATSQRREAERKLATFGDKDWTERLRAEIGGGAVHALLGLLDLAVLVSPFSPYDTSRPRVPKIDEKNLPSSWWERTLREHGLDTRGPAYNVSDLATLAALSAVPGTGPAGGIALGATAKARPIPRFETVLKEGKQGVHVRGHPNFDPSKSEMLIDPRVLVPWANEGEQVGPIPRGMAGHKEKIDAGIVVGVYRAGRSGAPQLTTTVIIHYDKNGHMHMHPGAPRD